MRELIFLAIGAAAGSAITWFALKKKYEDAANKEIEEVRAYYSQKADSVQEKLEEIEKITQTEKKEYSDILEDYSGTINERKEDSGDMAVAEPYIIDQDEYGEIEEYDTETLIYYNDGVLTDTNNIPIDDVDAVVGLASLECIDESENDTLYVRNDRLKTDYEICYNLDDYSDIVAGNLNLRGR